MDYKQRANNGINILFKGLEVETVREAYKEHIDYLVSLGNDSSVLQHKRWITTWTGDEHSYSAAGNEPLVETLQHLSDTTDECVDQILDIEDNTSRFEDAGKRYQLGQNAAVLLLEIELHSNSDK